VISNHTIPSRDLGRKKYRTGGHQFPKPRVPVRRARTGTIKKKKKKRRTLKKEMASMSST